MNYLPTRLKRRIFSGEKNHTEHKCSVIFVTKVGAIKINFSVKSLVKEMKVTFNTKKEE